VFSFFSELYAGKKKEKKEKEAAERGSVMSIVKTEKL
jgi:hypothetical protein